MRVPKEGLIDLHVHLDGSLGFDLAQKLAASQGMEVISGEALRARMQVTENCRDLNDYLTKFDYPLSLMQTEEAVKTSVYELLKIQGIPGAGLFRNSFCTPASPAARSDTAVGRGGGRRRS